MASSAALQAVIEDKEPKGEEPNSKKRIETKFEEVEDLNSKKRK